MNFQGTEMFVISIDHLSWLNNSPNGRKDDIFYGSKYHQIKIAENFILILVQYKQISTLSWFSMELNFYRMQTVI